MAKRTNQGGSAVIFIVIGIILLIGLIGTVYYVIQRGEQARKDQAIAAYDKQQAEKEAEAEESKSSEPNSSNENAENKKTDKPAVLAAELPVTGPELAIGNVFIVGALTVAISSYISSRRTSARYL